jgi:apolipoprotein N-acyltransferase
VTLAGGRTVRVAPLICYDAVDPGIALAAVRQGAELIVTLSNDSWFAAGGGPRLHLVVSAFRSLETRRPQLRATNTGVSAAIAATGEILAGAGVHERAVVKASVRPEGSATTLMLAWGDWFGPSAAAAALLLLAARIGRRSGPRSGRPGVSDR